MRTFRPDLEGIPDRAFAGGTALYPRPNLIPGVPTELHGSQYPEGKIFNNAAFMAAPGGQQGDFGRDVLRGFDAFQGDLAVQRQFGITEKLRLIRHHSR
jgi:hypothetical protein